MQTNSPYNIAILLYATSGKQRDASKEEKYSALVEAFINEGFQVQTLSYSDEKADQLTTDLQQFDMVLVWINPMEDGNDRKRLDKMLTDLASSGCLISTHPEVIIKMGTKDILYNTRDMQWGGNVKMYSSYDQFSSEIKESLLSGIRVLKQYRGNGGQGVFKVELKEPNVQIIHATQGNEIRLLSFRDFLEEFSAYFSNGGLIIDQPWNENITNGMVRCYVSGVTVAGFGYQEINALYPFTSEYIPPGKRYYFTEKCGLFSDLKKIMESDWVPELQSRLNIPTGLMPVIWDADFFINRSDLPDSDKYTLCEINVSCVSPFPPSAVKYIVTECKKRLNEL